MITGCPSKRKGAPKKDIKDWNILSLPNECETYAILINMNICNITMPNHISTIAKESFDSKRQTKKDKVDEFFKLWDKRTKQSIKLSDYSITTNTTHNTPNPSIPI